MSAALTPPTSPPPSPSGPPPAPVADRERIESVDVLRGVALLGILVMNIQAFSMIGPAYFNPNAYGDLGGANYLVWLGSHVLADQKFMTVFSMLFGAGIVIFASRIEQRGRRPAGLHYRRMMWLIIFGLLHAHLLWFGDILYSYGMCGLLVYPARRLSPAWLIPIGIVMITIGSLMAVATGLSMPFWPEEAVAELMRDWQPAPSAIAQELAAYRGSWLDQVPYRNVDSIWFQTMGLLLFIVWRVGGLMLIGMALFKLGVLSARRSGGFYAALIAVALGLGFPLTGLGVWMNEAREWDIEFSFFFGMQFNYWGSLFGSLGWIGLVMLVCRTGADRITRPLAAVGQMAFTNYILHTVICTTLFYGWGFGLFGSVQRVGQIGIVALVWAFQLIVSPIWLRHFRFGPLEWAWRSLSYWHRQPMRRAPA